MADVSTDARSLDKLKRESELEYTLVSVRNRLNVTDSALNELLQGDAPAFDDDTFSILFGISDVLEGCAKDCNAAYWGGKHD